VTSMIRSDLRLRVMITSAVAISVLAALAGWFAGLRSALGFMAAGAITIANFLWLTRGVAAAAGAGEVGRALVGWGVAAIMRWTALLAATAVVLVTGSAHPVALVIGLTVLPVAVVVEALWGAARPMDA
jgi:hypothetical protein